MKANKFIISALCLSLGAMTLAGCQDKAAPAKEGAEQAPAAAAPQENAAAPAAATDKVTMNVTGAGASFPQHAPAAGCQLGGFYVPGGTRIGVNPGVIHFDKSVFGDDADTFRPERWIEGDASNMDRYIMQFGMGNRTCLGKNVSLQPLRLPTALLFSVFPVCRH